MPGWVNLKVTIANQKANPLMKCNFDPKIKNFLSEYFLCNRPALKFGHFFVADRLDCVTANLIKPCFKELVNVGYLDGYILTEWWILIFRVVKTTGWLWRGNYFSPYTASVGSVGRIFHKLLYPLCFSSVYLADLSCFVAEDFVKCSRTRSVPANTTSCALGKHRRSHELYVQKEVICMILWTGIWAQI